MNNVYFAKVNAGAVIPSKRESDAGYDIYANIKDDVCIYPNQIKMIPTGLASAFDDDYVFTLFERGSSGSRGLSLRCGVIDSSYRGEIFVPINNTTNKPILITNLSDKCYETSELSVYSTKKAICQGLFLPVPKLKVNEITYEELSMINSDRGLGALGSSGK
jgi:dUTP pyrophosphatase